MLDLYIKGIVVGDEQELLEMGCRLHGNDGIHAAGGFIEDEEAQASKFLDHGKGQGQGELGRFPRTVWRNADRPERSGHCIALPSIAGLSGPG